MNEGERLAAEFRKVCENREITRLKKENQRLKYQNYIFKYSSLEFKIIYTCLGSLINNIILILIFLL